MPEKKTEVDKVLEPYLHQMASGMSDEDVAKKTQLSVRVIQRWRLKRNIKRRETHLSRQLETAQAISSFGEILGDVKQRTFHSPVLGAWEPPMFLVREHVDYDLFLQVVDAAYRILEMSEEDIAKGLGLTLTSVEQALTIYRHHRASSGQVCQTCSGELDPNRKSMFCSPLCEKLYAQRP